MWAEVEVRERKKELGDSEEVCKEMGQRRVRLGPAARLGPQPLGVRLKLKITHRGIIGEILAKGRKSP